MRKLLLTLSFIFSSATIQALDSGAWNSEQIGKLYHLPFYAGGDLGYGATTWQGLVPTEEKQNAAINISAPILAEEGGFVWGVFGGYELNPYFALEFDYMHYPDAKLFFDENSLFAFENDDLTTLNTSTESIAARAKVMMSVPKTRARAYSSIGIAEIHREDQMTEQWRLAPAFGVGLNFNVNEHIMVEFAGSFIAGYGESEIDPVQDYIPFLYAAFFKLAYRV